MWQRWHARWKDFMRRVFALKDCGNVGGKKGKRKLELKLWLHDLVVLRVSGEFARLGELQCDVVWSSRNVTSYASCELRCNL